ncbi:MAG: hypothetical protein IT383_13380 [Deltaproteobacteria bacterium]|nr:hypothetical protein [Deltaproteobacteria bacterium]
MNSATPRSLARRARALTSAVAAELLARVRRGASLDATGRERINLWLGDDTELLVADRLDDLRRLCALVGRRRVCAALGADLSPAIERDLDLVELEHRPLPADLAVLVPRYTRSSTSVAMLRATLARRRERAARVARAHEHDPARAFDASDNDLVPMLLVRDDATRATMLLDTLLQWRALRRSPELADRKPHGDDDNSQGRLTTSGLLASLELAQFAQRAPLDGAVGALARLCVGNAPHLAPSTIYQASNLTLALLGREGHGLLGRAFLPVYGAVHTLYCADTAPLVDRFVTDELCAGWPRAHAVALLGACVAVLRASPAELRGAWRRLDGEGARAAVALPRERAALLACVRARCRPGRLRRAPEAALLEHLELALRLHACVCAHAPGVASLAADATLVGPASTAVFRVAAALADGDGDGVVPAVSPARRALRRAVRCEQGGMARARLLRLDRELEHVLASALSDVVRVAREQGGPRARRLARGVLLAAVRGVVDSGLEQLGPPEAARVLVRAARSAGMGEVAIEDARAIGDAAMALSASLRQRLRSRARAVHFAGVRVLLDPRAPDRLIKETALHPLLELAALAARAPARGQRGVVPVRVIAPPRLPFARVVDDGAGAIDERSLVVARRLSCSARLPRAAAVLVAERDAPPGYSHLMVLARDLGVGVLATDDLDAARRTLRRGPAFLDGEVLRHGAPPATPSTTTRPPPLAIRIDLDGDTRVRSLRALAALPFADARALAGGKAATLAALRTDERLAALGAGALDAKVLPIPLVVSWARALGLIERWNDESAPATMRAAVRRGLRARFFSTSRTLSPQGRTLAAALRLVGAGPRIARASGSAEDLPGKSDAGLSRSVRALHTDAALVRAIIDIVVDVWRDDAVAQQRRAGVSMRQVWPAIVVQRDLGPRALLSGVAASRGLDGALGAISYQVVRGAGGGVRDGHAQEGAVSPVAHLRTRGRGAPLLSTARARVLGRAVLHVERLFHERLEPGAGHAVDVEWLWTSRGLVLVQARALTTA